MLDGLLRALAAVEKAVSSIAAFFMFPLAYVAAVCCNIWFSGMRTTRPDPL